MKKQTLIRFKIGVGLSSNNALILLLAKTQLRTEQIKEWKYNPVTGWVSVKIK